MGSKGSTNSTVTQTTIPEEFYPYFEDMLIRGEAASLEPYQAYEGQRIAGPSADTLASYDMIREIAKKGNEQMGMATDVTKQNIAAAQQLGEFDPYTFEAMSVDPYANFVEGSGEAFQYGPERQFSSSEVQQYMDPYMQSVVDIQKNKAISDYERAARARAAGAVQAGAFGGSRAAVEEGIAERGMLDRLSQIQAEGLQGAYSQAAAQFEADRAAQQAQRQAQAAELARTQGISVDEAARVQAAQAAELARTQGIDVSEAGRVQQAQADEYARARDQKLAGLQFTGTQAQQLASLGEMARAGDIQAAQLLESIGKSQEARQQAELDIAYQDFQRQQDYPMEQLQEYSAMIHGLPVANTGTTTTQVPYNPAQQALGMGISALGLYNAMGS